MLTTAKLATAVVGLPAVTTVVAQEQDAELLALGATMDAAIARYQRAVDSDALSEDDQQREVDVSLNDADTAAIHIVNTKPESFAGLHIQIRATRWLGDHEDRRVQEALQLLEDNARALL